MKAEEAIRDALQDLGQQAAEQPITGDWMQTGIRNLNRIMRGLDDLGLGYTIITSGSQVITVPPYAEDWIVCALAKRLAAQSTPTDQIQLIAANERLAWSNLLRQNIEVPQIENPSTLPVGSGNEGVWGYGCGIIFYPSEDDNILSEDGGDILLEDQS